MTIDITDQLRRIVYFGNDTTGPFSFPFEIINDTDLGIYVNDTLLTITSDYTVTINPDGTGEITLVIGSTLSVEPTSTDSIGIFGNKGIQRQTDFTTGGDLFANSLNDEFDAQTIFAQQNSEAIQRSLRAPITDPTDIDMLLPSNTDRAGTVLAFDSVTGAPQAGPVIADVLTIADIKDDITTVADFIDADNYVLKNSDAPLNSLDVNTIKNTGASVQFTSNIQMSGVNRISFGNGPFHIYSTTYGDNAYITNTYNGATTHIKSAIVSLEGDNGETLLTATENDGVDLYYDNAVKLSTSYTGIEVNGHIHFPSGTLGIFNGSNQGIAQFNQTGQVSLFYQTTQRLTTGFGGTYLYGDVYLGDNDKLLLGDLTGGDLRIYHNGTKSIIANVTGALSIESNSLECRSTTGEYLLTGYANGAVTLYYDNAQKLRTTSTGITVEGEINASGGIELGDNDKITFGANDDLQIYHDSSDSIINDNGTGSLKLQTGASTKLEVTSTGIDVTGDIAVSGNVDGIDIAAIPSTYVNVSGDTMTGSLTLNADPTDSLHAATKHYVDTIAAAGIHYHDPVRVESPTALTVTYNNGTDGVGATLTNAGTLAAIEIDGIALSLNDRVLVYTQTDATQNGIYTVTTVGDASTAWVLTRATDADSYAPSDPDSLGQGDAYFVKEGDTGAGELYVMNTSGVITFGTTDINFTQIAETAVYTAGTNITLDGTTFNVDDAFVLNTGDSMTGNLSFGDNDKAIFGAGSDLQIYHSGNNSFINEAGTGNLYITATSDLVLRDYTTDEEFIHCNSNDGVDLYYDGSKKLATTSTGIDVTGTVTADKAQIDSSGSIAKLTLNEYSASNPSDGCAIDFIESSAAGYNFGISGANGFRLKLDGNANDLLIQSGENTTVTNRFGVDRSTGDISFYEDTGTTAKFFWDASAERLGIGTNSPVAQFHSLGASGTVQTRTSVTGATASDVAEVAVATGSRTYLMQSKGSSGNFVVRDSTGAADRITLTTGGNVGIGTSSPDQRLVVGAGTGSEVIKVNAGTGWADLVLKSSSNNGGSIVWNDGADAGEIFYYHGSGGDYMSFKTNASERMRIDSSGNVGIGVTPSSWWSSYNALEINSAGNAIGAVSVGSQIQITGNAYQSGAGSYTYGQTGYASTLYSQSNGVHSWKTAPSGTAGNAITFSESMRIDSSGNLLVGTTSIDPTSGEGISLASGSYGGYLIASRNSNPTAKFNRNTSDGDIVLFRKDGTAVGSISVTGSATSYNTSSDYRLKTDVQSMTGATERLKALKPVNFEWISSGERTDGFLAHEAAEVVPEAVHGTKDAVDADGNPEYQSIDQSKLVPLLVATIQELEARITQLENS